MAMSDYHLCAVCGGKCFYDANITLNYDVVDVEDVYMNGNSEPGILPLGCYSMVAICKGCYDKGYRAAVIEPELGDLI